MSRGVNKVIIIGNLGQDPEVRFFPNGGSVCNVTIATSESWKDKQTGEMKEQTEWHRVSFSNRLAEIAAEYLKKGSKVYIEGSLRTRKWQNQQGQDQYTTEIRANEMQMLDSRPQAQQGGYQHQPNPTYGQQGDYSQQPAQGDAYNRATGAERQRADEQMRRQAQRQQPAPAIDFDDDIPFAPMLMHKMAHLVV